MAKGKKSSGTHYTSKGSVGVDKKISNKVRSDRSPAEIYLSKMNAFKKGRNVVFTIDNPNPLETNKRRIRVNARDIYGDHRSWFFGKKLKSA